MPMLPLKILFVSLALSCAAALEPSPPATPMKSSRFEKAVPATSGSDAKKSDESPPCPAEFNDSLDTNGIAGKVGKGTDVTPPRAIHSVNPQFSDKARKVVRDQKVKVTEFQSIVSLVVDTTGNPTSLCVKKAAGYGLDAEAGKAVEEYRFEPATKDGKPVAARISVAFSFRIY